MSERSPRDDSASSSVRGVPDYLKRTKPADGAPAVPSAAPSPNAPQVPLPSKTAASGLPAWMADRVKPSPPPPPPPLPPPRDKVFAQYAITLAAVALVAFAGVLGYQYFRDLPSRKVEPKPVEPVTIPNVKMPTGAYGDLWGKAIEAAAAFSAAEIGRAANVSAASVYGSCAQRASRLDGAVKDLIGTEPPEAFIGFHWKLLPLFEELVVAEKAICEGEASNNAAEIASGWAWVGSIQTMLSKTLSSL